MSQIDQSHAMRKEPLKNRKKIVNHFSLGSLQKQHLYKEEVKISLLSN